LRAHPLIRLSRATRDLATFSRKGRREMRRLCPAHIALAMRLHPRPWARKERFASKSVKGGGAPTGASSNHQRHTLACYHANMLRPRKRATQTNVTACLCFGRARLSALRERYLPRKLMPRLSPGRASCDREDAGVTHIIERTHSDAPRAPVIVPAGSMPGPPGSGVTSPARRNRTRPISRLSPVTSLRARLLLLVSNIVTVVKSMCHNDCD
jgi:hypothetical protein